MPENQNIHNFTFRTFLSIILLPLIVGSIAAAFIPQPKIGLINITEALDNSTGAEIVDQIQYAYNQPDIHAVVLIMDCPGGTINDTELVYLELNHLRARKPVVTMVQGLSASGSYYISMASDYILANPSAMVGNVGVIAQLPSVPIIYEEIYSTGPYKFWGSSRDAYVRQIDMMKKNFLQAVLLGRENKLSISDEQILRGEIYPASEAMQFGLIDGLGSQSEAIEKAAQIAKISHYDVIDLAQAVEKSQDEASAFFAVDEEGETTGYPKESGFYYLYIAEVKGGLK
jgi:protease-4